MHNLVCEHINTQPSTDQRQHYNLSRKKLKGPVYETVIEIINSMDESRNSFHQHPSMQTKCSSLMKSLQASSGINNGSDRQKHA